jgi:hypothetical protein
LAVLPTRSQTAAAFLSRLSWLPPGQLSAPHRCEQFSNNACVFEVQWKRLSDLNQLLYLGKSLSKAGNLVIPYAARSVDEQAQLVGSDSRDLRELGYVEVRALNSDLDQFGV